MNKDNINNDGIANASSNSNQSINTTNNMNAVENMNTTFTSNNKSQKGIVKYIILALVVVAICTVEYFVVTDMSSKKNDDIKEHCENNDSTDDEKTVEKLVAIPCAIETIQPRTKITDEMVDYVKAPKNVFDDIDSSSIIMDKLDIVGNYSNINTVIPKGSFFYQETVVDVKSLADYAVYEQKKGETLTYMTVNMASSYGNSIVPDGYIDLYIRITDSNGKIRLGKLASRIKVVAVKDNSGQNVFENSSENRVPAYLLFYLPNKEYAYFQKAAEKKYSIVPVPINVEVSDNSNANIMTNNELMKFMDNL